MTGKIRRIDWSPSEWLAGTRGLLTPAEAGIYDCVLNMIYDRGRACPNDAGFIAGHFRTTHHERGPSLARRTRAALDRLIELGKLNLSPDGKWLSNGRADRELGKAGERIVSAARAGHASGRARRAQSPVPAPTSPRPRPDPERKSSNTNGLARTGVRIINHQREESVSNSHTEAAREPSPELGAAQARAPTGQAPKETEAPDAESKAPEVTAPSNESAKSYKPSKKTTDRLAKLAAEARAKFLKDGT